MNELYNMIFKRKSMRKFNKELHISEEELNQINMELKNIVPLIEDDKIKFKIVKREKTTAKWGEYCLLAYSENKLDSLMNVGYMLEQIDLYFTSINIGACWYGMAKTNEKQYEGLDYIIMLAFGKSSPEDFRKSSSEFKRKRLKLIWEGDFNQQVKEALQLAPSACNTQPWRITNKDKEIKVLRNTKVRTLIPSKLISYFNSIDMGIVLCFLELSLKEKGYEFERIIELENSENKFLDIATYYIK